MVGWHQQLNGHESEETLRDCEGQENQGCKEQDMTQQLKYNNNLALSQLNTHEYLQLMYLTNIYSAPNTVIGIGVEHTVLCVKLHQLFSTPCRPYSPQGSSVHGILQSRILEWFSTPSPGNFPDPEIESASPLCPVLAAGKPW